MPAPAPPARSRAKLLARHGRASPALVCPLVLGQAAEIEALPMQWFLTDATKLANGLRALHGALGNDVIVTAAADGLAAAAAGAGSITAHPRVTAAVEATRRLAATADDAALAVALCGPARLAAQLGHSPTDHAVLEPCGAMLLALAKAFLEAGANLLLVVEAEALPAASGDSWRSAATRRPSGHLARPGARGVRRVPGGGRDADRRRRGGVSHAAALLGPGAGDGALEGGAELAGGAGRAVPARAARALGVPPHPARAGAPARARGRPGLPRRPPVHDQGRDPPFAGGAAAGRATRVTSARAGRAGSPVPANWAF